MNGFRLLLFGFIIVSTLFSCLRDKGNNAPDVSDIELEVEIRRFEKDLFAIDTNQVEPQLTQLEAAYPDFSQIYFQHILGSKDEQIAPNGHASYVAGFLKHPAVRKLYDTCMIVYPNLEKVEQQYTQAFKYFKYYFPEKPTPDVTTFISEYGMGAFIYKETSLGVGLDLFLGNDYPYFQYNPSNPAFSDYLTRTFDKDHLVAKSLHPLVEDVLGEPSGNRLLDLMIYYGKKLYILDHLLPQAPDSILFEVTQEQVEWLQDNELEMWSYFLQEELLYSSNLQDIRKYFDYSPNSPGMPQEAPGRTANWLGWKIVEKYMERYPDTSMEELVAMENAQKFMEKARYKPRR